MKEQQIPATVMMPIDMLKPYPRNKEFFRDLEGESYERLKQSIAEKGGLYHPILVAPDMTIVSGHQRWRAAKELGFKMVRVEVDPELVDEDSKMKALFECNWVREASPEEKRRNLVAYVEKFGLKQGRPGKVSPGDTLSGMSLDDIAEQSGVSKGTLRRQMRAQNGLIPELRKMMDDGRVSFNLAADTIASYPEDIQECIASLLTEERHYSDREVKNALAQVEREKGGLKDEVARLSADVDEKARALGMSQAEAERLRQTADDLRRELAARPVQEVRVEIVPDDYERLKRENRSLRDDQRRTEQRESAALREAGRLQRELDEKEQADREPENILMKRLNADVFSLESAVGNFVRDYGGQVWLLDHIDKLSDHQKERCRKAASTLGAWAQSIIEHLK